MTVTDSERERRKTILGVVRGLATERKAIVEAAQSRFREQHKTRKHIKDRLREGPATVPELARATGVDAATVLQHISSMRKYGTVIEDEADGSYFRYRLVEP